MVVLKLGKLPLLVEAGNGELLSLVHQVLLYLTQKVELLDNFMVVVLLAPEPLIIIYLITMGG